MVQGSGNYFREPTICYLNGSTLGGAAMKPKWIGEQMHLEFRNPEDGIRKIVTTSAVKNIKVIVAKEAFETLIRSARSRKSQ